MFYNILDCPSLSNISSPPAQNKIFRSSLMGMFGVRFSFVSTRSGLTRVRHYGSDDDRTLKLEALSFAHKHARAVDETYYSRTVDYNMLVNDSATLVQVPFNTFEKIRDRLNRYEMNQAYNLDASSDSTIETLPSESRLSVKDMNLLEKLDVLTNTSIHVIATQSIIVNEGTQRAVAGVTGVFYDYASFVLRFFNSTNNRFEDGPPITKPASCYTDSSSDPACDESKTIKCGFSNDTIDCLLIDNNGYIVISEELDFIGKHLKAYDPVIMSKLLESEVFQEINITDYQSICLRQEDKQSTTSSAMSSFFQLNPKIPILSSIAKNALSIISHTWLTLIASVSLLSDYASAVHQTNAPANAARQQQMVLRTMQSLLPNKTYLRPCEKIMTLYDRKPGIHGSERPEHYTSKCGCNSWFVYEEVPKTNLFLLIVDSSLSCRQGCDRAAAAVDPTDPIDAILANRTIEDQICSVLEREIQFKRKKPDSCFSQHSEEEHIKLCGGAASISPLGELIIVLIGLMTILLTSTRF